MRRDKKRNKRRGKPKKYKLKFSKKKIEKIKIKGHKLKDVIGFIIANDILHSKMKECIKPLCRRRVAIRRRVLGRQ